MVGDVEALCVDEALYELVIRNMPGAREPYKPNSEWEMVGAVQSRAQKKNDEQSQPLKVNESEVAELTAKEMAELQRKDGSLKRLLNMKGVKPAGEVKLWFWIENNVLCRSYTNPKVNCRNPVQQVVVPSVLRSKVLALAHDSIIGGHLRTRQTTDKVLSKFLGLG